MNSSDDSQKSSRSNTPEPDGSSHKNPSPVPADKPTLPPRVQAEVQRILDREARRMLAEQMNIPRRSDDR